MRKIISVLLCAVLLIYLPLSVFAAQEVTVTTTLTDNSLQRGSRKTFDVIARDAAGQKTEAKVFLNGEEVPFTWDDSTKTSFTLHFTKEGENTVKVISAGKTVKYTIIYKKAQKGEVIGTSIWSVEAFSLGAGYIIKPVEVAVREGENSAAELINLLHHNGLVGFYGGKTDKAFYIAYIADGDIKADSYENYKRSGRAENPRKLNIKTNIPQVLVPYLKKNMTTFIPDDYEQNFEGILGEFAVTNGSGWMYSVNNNFPNVGFSDTYLSDGDVVRVQFTLAYGADIGGGNAVGKDGTQYFPIADKTELTKSICHALKKGQNIEAALRAAEKLDASQSEVDSAVNGLKTVTAAPSKTAPPATDKPQKTAEAKTTDENIITTATPEVTEEIINTVSPTDEIVSETTPKTTPQITEKGKSGGNAALIIIIAAAVSALGTGVFFVIKRRKK